MPAICLITALPSEARPLIEHFHLSALGHKHLRLHGGNVQIASKKQNKNNPDDIPLYLLQCGVGKLNASANTAAMLQFLPAITAVINVGICGSKRALGETLIAHSVSDNASSQQWYPHLPAAKKLGNTPSVQVLTVDKPADTYEADIAFDMEASGVVNAAIKVIDLAFIHSVKVVSDNHESSFERISNKSVNALMSNCIPTLDQLLNALPFDALPAAAGVDKLSQSLQQRLHYSTTEQHSLKQLLQRHMALFGELPSDASLQEHTTAKSIRQHLVSKLDNASISY